MTPVIGFVLVTYKNPRQVIRLFNKLNSMFDHPPIACHHDFLKSNLPTDALSENIKLVRSYLCTGWGSFSVVEAMLLALRLLYENKATPDWFVFLSEADYPIKPASAIVHDLTSSPYDVHMHHEEIVFNSYERGWQLECFNRYCTMKYKMPMITRRLQLTAKVVSIQYPFLTRPFLPFSKNLRCFAGEHWFCANRKAAEYLIDFHRSNPALANHYRRLEAFTIIPEESYYHTVLCNAPNLTIANNTYRYIDWTKEGRSPKILTLEDLAKIQASNSHFARKFDISEDAQILAELDSIAT